MGSIYTQLNLSNPSNEALLPMDVEALVHSGSASLCIPRHVAWQLQLRELHQREIMVANNAKEWCPYVGPVHVKFQNRECMTGALVVGEQVLLGALPMEDTDLQVDPLNQRVTVNPASPNIPTAAVM